ncbi:MAG: hypothetical protein HQL52_12335 [Magnetococcales bacterium]|nr:hypothetical protein [Magnetococcales bacterium]
MDNHSAPPPSQPSTTPPDNPTPSGQGFHPGQIHHGTIPPSPPPNQLMGYPPSPEMEMEESIDLLVYWRLLMDAKWLIMLLVLLSATLFAAIAYRITPVYRAETMLLPQTPDTNQAGMRALAQFGGLANAAGFSLDEPDAKAQAILVSRTVGLQLIHDEEMFQVLMREELNEAEEKGKPPPTIQDAYKKFKEEVRTIQNVKKTGLVRLSMEWENPVLAAAWANRYVILANNYLREDAILEGRKNIDYLTNQLEQITNISVREAIYRMIEMETQKVMLAEGRLEYGFKVIDPAIVIDLDKYSKPNRPLMLILGAVLGMMLGITLALVRGISATRKQNQS